MTPEEARALEPGTTDEPWKLLYRDTHPNAIPANVIIGEDEEALATYDDGYGGNPEWANPSGNLPLIAAAPDMRATIAALRWEYGVEQDNVTCNHIEHGADPTRCRFVTWCPDENTARIAADMPHRADRHPRIVRRLVSAIEETP